MGGETPDEVETYAIETDIYREDIKNYVRRRSVLEDNMGRAYEIIWGQCSQQMRAKVEFSNNYDVVHNNSDILGLIQLINISSFDFHSQKKQFSWTTRCGESLQELLPTQGNILRGLP